MEKKLHIGKMLFLNQKIGDGETKKDFYQIESFERNFILCRNVKSGYCEAFHPHELYQNGIISWRQVLDYMIGTRELVCEV